MQSQPQFSTVVVSAQPVPVAQGQGKRVCSLEGHRDWSSGLLSCCDDLGGAIMAWCCMPCVLCDISKRTGECSCMPFCVQGSLITLRTRIRTLGGIQGSVCDDCLVTTFCGYCAVCQMQRELGEMGL